MNHDGPPITASEIEAALTALHIGGRFAWWCGDTRMVVERTAENRWHVRKETSRSAMTGDCDSVDGVMGWTGARD